MELWEFEWVTYDNESEEDDADSTEDFVSREQHNPYLETDLESDSDSETTSPSFLPTQTILLRSNVWDLCMTRTHKKFCARSVGFTVMVAMLQCVWNQNRRINMILKQLHSRARWTASGNALVM